MADDDPLTRTRLDVAEMKGMLTQALGDHGQRLGNVEDGQNILHGRLSDQGHQLARADERLKDLEDDNSGRLGRVTGLIGTGLAILAGAIAIYNLLNPVG